MKSMLWISALIVTIGASALEVEMINKLTAADPVDYERFGHYGIAMDANTAVVGVAYDECSPGSVDRCGSAVVFEYNATSRHFERAAKLTASDANANDQFGLSVGVSGDTIVVGAYGDDEGMGAIYVFRRPESGWHDMNQSAKLTASDAQTRDYLGYSVAISGDTVVAGAYGDKDEGDRTGSAYLFVCPESGWHDMNQSAKLTASDAEFDSVFGGHVAIDGDTVVVGAPEHDAGATDSGAAYLYVRPLSGWTDAVETAKLTASDPAYNDRFGGAVALEGGVVLSSAYLKQSVGHVYLFERPSGGWADATETAKLTASDAFTNDTFGRSVDVQGNLIAVGAHFDDENGPNSGSVYLFSKPSAGWSDANETMKFWPPDTTEDSYFGDGLQISGSRIIVSAPLDPCEDGPQCGSAYVYSWRAQTMAPALLMYLLN